MTRYALQSAAPTLAPCLPLHRPAARQRGAVIILAMMFLVIFGALAAALAIVAQGNLATADSYLKINRTLAAAETGMHFLIYRINQVTTTIKTRDGLIDDTNAPALWDAVRIALRNSLSSEWHNLAEPLDDGRSLRVGPVSLGAGAPTFTATLQPHPIPGENYDSPYYQRPPYSHMNPPVSNANPLGPTWIRARVQASEGSTTHPVTRAIQMDFCLEKKINFAILSRSRIMIGRHVLIKGPVGSRFTETDLPNGHPVQMESDFRGLHPQLDAQLDRLVQTLPTNDINGDNRLHLADIREVDGIDNPSQYDTDGDGYIDDYDFFLAHYDTARKGYVTAADLNAASDVRAAQLLELIDTFGDPGREGYNDGIIDERDHYAKLRGQVLITASLDAWQAGAAAGFYQRHFQGPIAPKAGRPPLVFQAPENDIYQFQPSDFDVSTFRHLATGDLLQQTQQQLQGANPQDPSAPRFIPAHQNPNGPEAVPYGAAHPYDFYHRPVFENMTFVNVRIPKGTNALFRNCRFIGCTFVETTSDNSDPNFNYAGMQEADGSIKYPNLAAMVNGQPVSNTKAISNNVRFDSCTFEGSVVSDVPSEFTQARNKIAFTGRTRFHIEDSTALSDEEKALYRRSTILAPHYSVEMGTFVSPGDSNETVQLSGTIVAGVIDMRGQVKLNGTILTTFEPRSDTGPVVGQTSPQFNTTLGYFPSSAGDMEAELPSNGLGVIHIRYDPTIPLPDGILGPISLRPDYQTWFETGAQ